MGYTCSYCELITHSFNKYLLCAYYVPTRHKKETPSMPSDDRSKMFGEQWVFKSES